MDLSFTRLDRAGVTALPTDLPVLLVGVAARQAVSPTALIQTALTGPTSPRAWYAPEDGAFNTAVAALVWIAERDVKPPFTEPL